MFSLKVTWRACRPYGVLVDFEALLSAARRDGWASGSGDIDGVRNQAKALGCEEVPTRRGDSPVSVLRPADRDTAHPRSLSAQYGLGQQPLHTDGVHLADPPDFVVLVASRPSPTPTLVWRVDARVGEGPGPIWSRLAAFGHGMFLVHSGRDSFYVPAYSAGRYRYDPGCMTACDARAREVEKYLAGQLAKATAIAWTDGGQVLVVDNRRVLHARAAMAEGDGDRELTRVAFRAKVAQ
jgi:hypothetical protein